MADDMQKKLKILFSTDFSASSRKALKALQTLQHYYELEIYFIHVIDKFWHSWFSSGLYEKEQMHRLESWQLRLENNQLKPENLIVKNNNNVAKTIISEADRLQVDMIVIGGYRPNEYAPRRANSTAKQIVRYAKQTVLLCKKDNLDKVICGIDGSTNSAKALSQTISFCKSTDSSLSIVNILPRIDFNPLGMQNEDIHRKEEEFRQSKKTEINHFLDHFDYSDLNVERHILWGQTPSHVILCMAEDFDYDVIAIGATGQSAISLTHMMMGSTAEQILVNSPSSLLVVR